VTVLRERGNLLHGVEMFFVKDWSDRVSSHIFGSRAAHPLLRSMLQKLMQGEALEQVLAVVPEQLDRDISLFPPNIFTPLPIDKPVDGNHTFDEDGVLAFEHDDVYARLRAGIPKKLHFVHLGPGISMKGDRCVRSWLQNHPGWHVRIWRDSDIPDLEVAPLVRQCRSMAQMSDIMRLEILVKNGGLYADTDIENFKNVDRILAGASGVIIHEEEVAMLENSQITNALFGGIARHPLLSRAMTLLWLTPVLNTRWVNVETGPAFLGQKLTGPDLNKFRVLPTRYFHPIHYSDRKLFLVHGCYEESCKHLYPGSYGMHLLAQKDTWYTHTQSPNQPAAAAAAVASGKKSKDATKRLTELLAAVARHNQAAIIQT